MRKNLGLKLFSVLMSLFLWSIISHGRGGERMEIGIGVPLELHNIPADMELVSRPAERINVRLTGPARVVSRLSQMDLKYALDLSGAAEGPTTIEIFRSDLKVPQQITVTRVSPSSVTLWLERSRVGTVTVEPVVNGSPLRGHRVQSVLVKPDKVRIKGPRTRVSKIKSVKTAPIEISGLGESLTEEVALLAPKEGITILDKPAATVQVSIVADTAAASGN